MSRGSKSKVETTHSSLLNQQENDKFEELLGRRCAVSKVKGTVGCEWVLLYFCCTCVISFVSDEPGLCQGKGCAPAGFSSCLTIKRNCFSRHITRGVFAYWWMDSVVVSQWVIWILERSLQRQLPRSLLLRLYSFLKFFYSSIFLKSFFKLDFKSTWILRFN